MNTSYKLEIDALCVYLEECLISPDSTISSPDIKNPTLQALFGYINQMVDCLREMYQTTLRLADGNLQTEIKRTNLYAGALKDLQASLKHLVWQVGRVADGDYQIQVSFLGDFSTSFDALIQQLSNREAILKDNARLTEELAKNQTMLLESELQRVSDRYEEYIRSMEEVRSYRHDMKNHLLCIDSLLQEGGVIDARKYIQSISNAFPSNNQKAKSDNFILDALLNDKLMKAKKMGVQVHQEIQINRKLNIENKDLCILIGNALDNSLEALKKVDKGERELFIKIILSNDMLSVDISNTMSEIPTIVDDKVITSKKDKKNHGIGLTNIKKTVLRYRGEMEILIDDGRFHLIFLLCGI